jgi:hypothetical protein
MKLIALTIMLTASLIGQQDYEILVNGSSSSNEVYSDRPNEFVIRGRDADKIRLTSTHAYVRRNGNTYTLTLKGDHKEIVVLATYKDGKDIAVLGYFKFQVRQP